jgi:hypothetical protein
VSGNIDVSARPSSATTVEVGCALLDERVGSLDTVAVNDGNDFDRP